MLRKISIAMVIIAVALCLRSAIVIFSYPEIEEITLNYNKIVLCLNDYDDSRELDYNVYPEKAGKSLYGYKWSSSNTNVAVVNNYGKVEAVSVGEAIITFTYKNFSVSCPVIVQPQNVWEVNIDYPYSTIHINETMQLTSTITPSNATYQDVTWASLNPQVATVSETGLVTGVAEGETTIVATSHNGITDQVNIKVQNVIELDDISLNLKNGSATNLTISTYTLIPTFYPANADNKALTWESSNPSVMTVDENGVVSIKKDGGATITATSANGKSDSIYLNVPRVAASMVTIDKPNGPNVSNVTSVSCTIRVGTTLQLTASLIRGISSYPYLSSSGITTRELVWSSTQPSVVSISETGLVTALAETYPLGIQINVYVKDVPSVSDTFLIIVKP